MSRVCVHAHARSLAKHSLFVNYLRYVRAQNVGRAFPPIAHKINIEPGLVRDEY